MTDLRVAIVAGEASGDVLGAGLMAAIKERRPDVQFEGIGGPQMLAQGLHSLFPADELAIMGLAEVLRHLPRILRIRSRLLKHFLAWKPQVFIGIDSPDFNLPLEGKLRRSEVPTVHYVSPSVWAWRRSRIHGIARSVDRMLVLFPFEEAFYREYGVPARFVGHPLAERIAPIDLHSGREAARVRLGLPQGKRIIAMLPGSRPNELHYLAAPFLQAAVWCCERRNDLHFVVPLLNDMTRSLFERARTQVGAQLPMTLVAGQSLEAMGAAEAVLLASGTATLEAMLVGRPMAVAYRMSAPTYWLAKRLVHVPHIALPNLLAGRALVPELIQHDASPENLGAALLRWLDEPERVEEVCRSFAEIGATLKHRADQRAAEAVLELLSDAR